MKFSDTLRMASGSMWRNKTRTILTIVAIFVAAFTITLTTAIGAGVSSYLDKQTDSFGAPNMLQVMKATEDAGDGPAVYDPDMTSNFGQSMATLSAQDVDKIESIDNVESVTPFVGISPSFISADGSEKYVLTAQQFMRGQNADIVAGAVPKDGDTPEIIVSPKYVKALGFSTDEDAVGASVSIGVVDPLQQEETIEATISGVMNESLLSAGRLWMNDSLQEQVAQIGQRGLPATVTDQYLAAVAFATDTDPETLTQVKADLESLGFVGQTVEDQIGIAKQIFDAITTVLTVFGVIALLAASLGVINTLYMSVQDRTKEIGLMKASGLSSGKVFGLFSIEAMLLGLWGSLLGILAAWGLGQAVNSIAAESFLKDFPGFDLTLFPIASLAVIVGVILVITFLAGTLPARRAAKLNPIDALRYE
ncbi:ABC transporter permease [Lysinibacter cavernae]|uniref:Putative ABC transport system permease protein n=1 Tax=Lysinibacter cavernae TaxID=1640652 RepID=A0A7X5R1C9_9MICO|nr:ABC transporter permease [Lysinibacter cavernae]NIH53806.1 putative ABC transport system permease protein [Lysinibacter cavernae]